MISNSVPSTRCKWTKQCKRWKRNHLHSLSDTSSQLMQPESTLSQHPWQKFTDECCPCISHTMLQPLLQYTFIQKLHAKYHHTQADVLRSAVTIFITDYAVNEGWGMSNTSSLLVLIKWHVSAYSEAIIRFTVLETIVCVWWMRSQHPPHTNNSL